MSKLVGLGNCMGSLLRRIARRHFYYLMIIGIVTTPIYFFYLKHKYSHPSSEFPIFGSGVFVSDSYDKRQSCKHPTLELWDSEISKHFQPTPPIVCDPNPDWVCIDRGFAFVCNDTIKKKKSVRCTYTFLKRVSDHKVELMKSVEAKDGEKVALKSDFFQVKCVAGDKTEWENVMAGIRHDPKVFARTQWEHLPDSALGLNVLMWGFDSLSRLTFMRKLPKTYEYITKELEALVLKGYNIVGDGTPQALIPIFTGETEPELPETRKRMEGKAFYVNVYPFVWKNFENNGYATAYSEDCPSIGTFTYRLKGFDEPPTDHYMRTFYVQAEKQQGNHLPLCLRGTPRHVVLMNWVKHFFAMYESKPKFMFTFHSELSHDDYNKVGAADEDLLKMVKFFKEKNYLNNTLLIIMSDHGHRFASFRETQQGKQEERLPFFSFVFPPWFKKRYPEAFKNFKTNTERLTSPFDLHPTLHDILQFRGAKIANLSKRGISLFHEIPLNRTCNDAAIEPHWCACLNMEKISADDPLAVGAAQEVVRFINKFTENQRNLCEPFTLDVVTRASKYSPGQGLLKFKQSADHDGFKPDLSDKTSVSVELLQVDLFTKPGKGHFEASVKYDVKNKKFTVKLTDISRINKYGNTAHCILQTLHHLRPYCYCKIQIINHPNSTTAK